MQISISIMHQYMQLLHYALQTSIYQNPIKGLFVYITLTTFTASMHMRTLSINR